jgi:hypothetical protein
MSKQKNGQLEEKANGFDFWADSFRSSSKRPFNQPFNQPFNKPSKLPFKQRSPASNQHNPVFNQRSRTVKRLKNFEIEDIDYLHIEDVVEPETRYFGPLTQKLRSRINEKNDYYSIERERQRIES